ncbi:hypothetical protein NKH19_02140 [Mesorhizobium sp. M1338]
MQSQDGNEVNDGHCCFLQIVPNERLVWSMLKRSEPRTWRPRRRLGRHA